MCGRKRKSHIRLFKKEIITKIYMEVKTCNSGHYTKISVITVCYNAVESIENTIRSVISQTYSNVEFIVIDGHSSDGTVDIIKKYEDKICKWVSERDKGVFDAMNKAIDMATGEWLLFMNAGDTFAEKDVICSFFNGVDYDEDVGVVFGDAFFLQPDNSLSYYKSSPFAERKCGIRDMGICHQAIFTRTSLARRFKFDFSYKYAADYNMMMNIFKSGYKFSYNTIPVCVYNLDGISSNNKLSQFKEIARICGVSNTTLPYFQGFMKTVYIITKIKIVKVLRKLHLK